MSIDNGLLLDNFRGVFDGDRTLPCYQGSKYGILISRFHFFCILELYNPDTCTFFTPCGEFGLALHKMYEEYVSIGEELHLLSSQYPLIYDTYWKLLYHYHICAHITQIRNNGIKQKAWADYLFPNFIEDNSDFSCLLVISEKEIEERISCFDMNAYVTESNEDVFKAGISFDSFHYQAKYWLSDSALLV